LREVFPDADRSGINQSRVCYESWDENIYINPKVAPFTKIKTVERVELKQQVEQEQEVFTKLMKWITNTGNAFVKGRKKPVYFQISLCLCKIWHI
jgi:hypothetical protein